MDDDLGVANHLGNWIAVDSEDPRGHALVKCGGNFNPNSLEMWRLLCALANWDTILDVGANYGEMLLGIELPDHAEVVAYEPNPGIARYLRKNIENAGLAAEVREVAVSRDLGTGSLLIDLEWSGTTCLDHGNAPGSARSRPRIAVPLVSLDAEYPLPSGRSFAIKIDVEGTEMDVISGSSRLFREADRVAAMIEILHMDEAHVADLSRQFPLYFLELETLSLVRMSECSSAEIAEALQTEVFYRQDAIITSVPIPEFA